ncbi:hypothetical protein GNF51_16955, partial [Clostridium perfringens]|uniref:Nif3-like dinuclear metal center hexameric protein n=1 Tax=Clostridium perfringens TaxID=1502 RepID=UPI002AC59092
NYANLTNIKLKDLAIHIKNKISVFGQDGVIVIGDLDSNVNRLGIGTGAITDIFEMSANGADTCIVTDDGINNWYSIQYGIDNSINLIIINHAISEIPGIISLSRYLNELLPNIETIYLQ